MANYEKIQKIRDELGWTDEDLVQFALEFDSWFKDVLGGKNKDSSNSTEYSDEEMFIRQILVELGVPTNFKGYYYTITAVLLCIKDSRTYYNAITTVLYPQVAEKYNTTASRVDRAIRHVVETMKDNGNKIFYNRIFAFSIPSHKDKPTNSHFISTLTEYVKMYLPKWRSGTWEP